MASLMTPVGMLSFPQLFTARAPVPGADPRFSLSLVVDKAAQKTPEWVAIREMIEEVFEDKWPGKFRDADWQKKNKIKFPIRQASEKDYSGYDQPGAVFISPWTKNKPGLVDARRQDIITPSEVWAGQLARCTVHGFAYDTSGNKGVGLMLNNVQITKADMPRLDGRKDAKAEFGNAGSDTDLDDDVPF